VHLGYAIYIGLDFTFIANETIMVSSPEAAVLAVLVKPSALLSMIGSALIIREIMIDPKKRSLTYHRILFCMSVIDFSTSSWFFVSTWAIPKDTANVFLASGTEGSCQAQGGLISLNIASPLYNLSLSIYYILMIKCKWTQESIRSWASPFLLLYPIAFASGVSIAGFVMDLYAPAGMWCWIAPHPQGCVGLECAGSSGRSNFFRWLFFYGPLWVTIVFMGVFMAIIYTSITKGDGKDALGNKLPVDYFWFFSKDRTGLAMSKADRNRRMIRQAIWYMLAFNLTWVWPTAVRATEIFKPPPYGLYVMMAIFAPLQGFLNYISYIRPRYLRNKELHPEWTFFHCIILFDPEDDFKLGAYKLPSVFEDSFGQSNSLVKMPDDSVDKMDHSNVDNFEGNKEVGVEVT